MKKDVKKIISFVLLCFACYADNASQINVWNYGVTGNGSNETAKIQSVIDMYKSRAIYFPKCSVEYFVDSIVIDGYGYSGLSLIGENENTVIRVGTGGIVIRRVDNVSISKLKLVPNGNMASIVTMKKTRWCKISDVTIGYYPGDFGADTYLADGITLVGGPLDSNDNAYNLFSNVKIRKLVGYAIVIGNNDTTLSRNNANTFRDVLTHCKSGVKIAGSSGNVFDGIVFENIDKQVHIEKNIHGVPSTDNSFNIVWAENDTAKWLFDSVSTPNYINISGVANANIKNKIPLSQLLTGRVNRYPSTVEIEYNMAPVFCTVDKTEFGYPFMRFYSGSAYRADITSSGGWRLKSILGAPTFQTHADSSSYKFINSDGSTITEIKGR